MEAVLKFLNSFGVACLSPPLPSDPSGGVSTWEAVCEWIDSLRSRRTPEAVGKELADVSSVTTAGNERFEAKCKARDEAKALELGSKGVDR